MYHHEGNKECVKNDSNEQKQQITQTKDHAQV